MSIWGPEWNDVDFTGLDREDPRYQYQAQTEFGQGTAKDNMNRYGFQGVFQNYLQGETERMKRDEMSRIQKLASGLVPGQASLRGGLASQGLGGSTSNVIARQQREQGLGKALDEAGQQFESSSARLDSQYFGATQQNEALRFGASQDYMKSLGMQTGAQNEAGRFNADAQRQIGQFNSQGEWDQRRTNAQGSFQAESQQSQNMWGFANQMLGIGGSLAGMGIAGQLGGLTKSASSGMGGGGGGQFGGFGGNTWNSTPSFLRPTNNMRFP